VNQHNDPLERCSQQPLAFIHISNLQAHFCCYMISYKKNISSQTIISISKKSIQNLENARMKVAGATFNSSHWAHTLRYTA